ncbi:MAG: iron-sulfur protein [Deltaproteobacteria bacterium]|nr:MAG: iron-sulfur protein [Deltaproteobacteria bacterium]
MGAGFGFKPKIIGIVCNWCCYAGADLCGVSRYQYPSYIRLIRVMCSGRVDMRFIFEAFLRGADAVFIGGCWPGDCHYITHGNYYALNMILLCKRLMEHIGLSSERLRIEWVSAGEGLRFAEIMREFSKKIEELGPLGKGEGIEEERLRAKLEELKRLIPYIKLVKKEKLFTRLTNEEEYENFFTKEEIERLLSEVPSYYIDPEKCQGCGICRRRCPAEAITGDKKKAHVIDQEKCIKCGTCFEACPQRFSAVRKIVGSPVPPPIPEEKSLIKSKTLSV